MSSDKAADLKRFTDFLLYIQIFFLLILLKSNKY